MRRILVPLDGTAQAASILPDARRLAGPDGTLILIRHASPPTYNLGTDQLDDYFVEQAEDYLQSMADDLEAEGVRVEIHLLALGKVSVAIDEAAIAYHADMIACSTNGRTPFGRLFRGGVAWKALAHSSVPVLLKRVEPAPAGAKLPIKRRRIMVPLDQSEYAEQALPLARTLQDEWNARLVLVAVVPNSYTYPVPTMTWPPAYWIESERDEAAAYLTRIAKMIPGAETEVCMGLPTSQLVAAAREREITDVVMTTHGRTGLPRVVLGSIADELVHVVSLPVIVIPSLAAERAAPIPTVTEEKEPAPVR